VRHGVAPYTRRTGAWLTVSPKTQADYVLVVAKR
jgi:hypothetical protein